MATTRCARLLRHGIPLACRRLMFRGDIIYNPLISSRLYRDYLVRNSLINQTLK
jgi:hypothetical protein